MASLQASPAAPSPDTLWQVSNEFNRQGQKWPLDRPEQWLPDILNLAIQQPLGWAKPRAYTALLQPGA
ncbi:hypothetical protein [Hymenobacter terrenus]|uniref:hypothetical protein n=1 Tax=Hymenobacter terrenus TaxID=1629124 RepID=UPI000619E94A|nr:hypothetical protein [Hymenobacter terrenus]